MTDTELAKLRWRCRRGMRELDMLLLDYLDRHYGAADATEQGAFEKLLTVPDPEILALLTGQSKADDEALRNVIERLLSGGKPA
ncbi:MAG: succinate dehydrogenase assembly factor 2 [Gammaproteobacteria bacterium]|jgi:antitoxin CptB|nr:succinate dehydrogenase assembly factor 2 [Gammaproteobacteria bacterium]